MLFSRWMVIYFVVFTDVNIPVMFELQLAYKEDNNENVWACQNCPTFPTYHFDGEVKKMFDMLIIQQERYDMMIIHIH